MPQLNPTPWLMMMLMAWLTINVMSTLINSNLMQNPTTPTKMNNHTKKSTAWTWPW
uniref:ATP synthase complex subunit 8 n=1 Tax=Furcifer oustaleti TaxID=179927 RepID=A1IGR9_FUROU|nr:ATP synthase F0 subunit 8 [Furcifer oustaleti]BAF44035.1 ATPase subunit 8 [Furcifer oustaleti]